MPWWLNYSDLFRVCVRACVCVCVRVCACVACNNCASEVVVLHCVITVVQMWTGALSVRMPSRWITS